VMKAGHFVLRKAVARRWWGRMSKKGKREESSDEESSEDELSDDESSDEESSDEPEDEVIGVEAGLDLSDKESEEEEIGVEMDSDSDSKEEESITTTKTSLPLPPALKTKDVPKTKGVKDGVEREGAESWVDGVIGCKVGVASWLEEGQSEEAAVKTGGDVQCEEDAVLKKGDAARAESGVDETVGSGVGAVNWLVKERGAEVSTEGGGVRCDKEIALERTEEGDMLRDMEGVGQRGVEDEGTKKSDEEQSKIREGRKTSKLRGKLTKKDKRQLLQGIDKVFSRDNGLRRRHRWKRHQQIVEDLEKRWELSKRSRDLRRHLQSRRRYVAPQIGSALACFLSPLHMEIKDRKEIEGVDEQEKG